MVPIGKVAADYVAEYLEWVRPIILASHKSRAAAMLPTGSASSGCSCPTTARPCAPGVLRRILMRYSDAADLPRKRHRSLVAPRVRHRNAQGRGQRAARPGNARPLPHHHHPNLHPRSPQRFKARPQPHVAQRAPEGHRRAGIRASPLAGPETCPALRLDFLPLAVILCAQMSTMAVLRKHAHERVSFGVRSGTTLVPVDFKQVTPDSGFDWVQNPHWLMVPTSSTNQAIAVTRASSNFTVNFSIQPNSSGSQLSVSPTSTTSSNQTITVTSSGTNVSETYQVQVGVGTTTSSGTNSAGLCLDVKPMTTGTIAIHAVTQHYTQPMAPPSVSGSFTPGTVCVTWGHVGHTTPTSPDQYNLGETAIVTGSDGICHTTAVDGDTQVIHVGKGIPADIVPQDTPSASDLQTYLNQVFGKQANLYFNVVRNDFSVNYDLNLSGTLDMTSNSRGQSDEQQVIDAQATSGVTFNIYCVKNYNVTQTPGLPPPPSNAGWTYWNKRLAYVRDQSPSYAFWLIAHETGHLLNLGHTDWTSLPSGATPNPAGPPAINDPSPSDRLMYSAYAGGTNTYLIQPEWDIINPIQLPSP